MKSIFHLSKTFTVLLAFFAACTLFSCENMGGGGLEGSPEETMKNFMEKLTASDFEGAKAFASTETDATLDFLKIRINMLKEMGKADQIPALFGGIDISQAVKVTCTTTDKTASCDCCEEVTGNCNKLQIIQEGNKWLVHQPKESSIE